MRFRISMISVFGALALSVVPFGTVSAQEVGCCLFLPRPGDRPSAVRCDNLTSEECRVLKVTSTFLRDRHCDSATQLCVLNGRNGTPQPTATPTPTATPRIQRRGCCQLDNLRRTRQPVCGNEITEDDCLNDFAGDATFCADCTCSAHSEPGFEIIPGTCVPNTPTPTPSPEPRGCCQLDNLRGARGP